MSESIENYKTKLATTAHWRRGDMSFGQEARGNAFMMMWSVVVAENRLDLPRFVNIDNDVWDGFARFQTYKDL